MNTPHPKANPMPRLPFVRRFLAFFVLSAMIPLGIIGVFAYHNVSAGAVAQTEGLYLPLIALSVCISLLVGMISIRR